MQTPPPPPVPSQGAGPAPGLEYGGFGVRLVALIIDGIILGLISGAVSTLLGIGFVGWYGVGSDILRTGFGGFGAGWFVYVLVNAAISGVYFVYTWTHGNATPGQRILNLEVRNAADGTPMARDQAIRRWIFLILPIVNSIPGLGIIVALYNLFLAYTTYTDPAKQGFHDKQAGTVVVRRMA
jgi:uncharacterized RDD family membrane protein YckC